MDKKNYLKNKVDRLAGEPNGTIDKTPLVLEEIVDLQNKQVENFAKISESAPSLTGALGGLLTIVKDVEKERRKAVDEKYEKALLQKENLDKLTNEIITLIEGDKKTIAKIKAKAISWIDTGDVSIDKTNREIYDGIRADLISLASQ